jgi:hypothetical protein
MQQPTAFELTVNVKRAKELDVLCRRQLSRSPIS